MEILRNRSLKELNWWKVGGTAQFFAQPRSSEDVLQAVQFARANHLPLHILSGGSNVLIPEGELPGLVLHMSTLSGISDLQENDRVSFTCLAGTPKSEAAKIFLSRKLAPAVFLTGLPGDMGGGVVMNAGVGEARVPREFCEIIDWIEVLDLANSAGSESSALKVKRLSKADLHWEYRHSKGWQPGVILRMGVSWENSPNPQVLQDVREANKKRVATQPLNQPSCGSVFRNPPGLKSAKLIEECGLKGFQIGGAQVSTKHANFIVNLGGATARDVLAVIEHVQKVVLEKHSVALHREVVLFGEAV